MNAAVSWADAAVANPIEDLRTWQKLVAQDSGYKPQHIFMTQARAYVAFIKRQEELKAELDALPRRAYVRRYKIERKLGHSRRTLLLPRRVRRALSELEWKWSDWKHRNDPYWGLGG